ncbi:adhesion G-protein coupled receptor D2 [Ursus americanus]|uniref:adhesion G-protein coupled receptor D2 n=1 Tax=Ursus americanus TaxID=9643 RepID=UPI001E67C1E8|nr:adhesion G-protein coupled receptor D2 [Ursus americanus]
MASWRHCLLYLLIRSLSGTPSNSPAESRSSWVAAPVRPGEVVATADGVCKFPGQQLSWWQAQESCEQRFGHLALAPPAGVLAPRLPNPIWVRQKEAPLRRPPKRRALTTAALVFGERTADRAARLRTPLPALGALTACAHVQWDAASPDMAALFSLAAPALANALQLRAFAEPGGTVHAALVVRGHHAPFLAAFRADGRWHHVCATWEQHGGRWALFADGRRRAGARGLGAGHPVPAGGILVLGQDQDSLGGGFSVRDAFSGNLTDFHLWARALSPAQLRRARACAPPRGGLLFRWDLGALDITPSLLPPLRVRLLCPMPSEECPTWNPGSRTEGSLLCLQPRPFLCCYRTETYQRLQDAQSWPGQDVISRVNALANTIVLLPDPLSEAHGHLSLAEASSFLGILERVLAKEAAPLGPAALLAIVHFLKRVTALGAGEPEPLTGPWEQLGQGVMSVASLVLDEQLAGTWLSVSEVVGGPMALVASVQRLAPLLSSVLTSQQPRLHIQHPRAGLEVQSTHLTEASTEGYVFTMPRGHPEGPGHIRIPAGEVKRLLGKGLSRVTVICSWFSSSVFQHTAGEPGLEPQASDRSEETRKMQGFLSTQVGSAIISAEVWDETGEVSTAVTFHLQHQAQVPGAEPFCSLPSPSPDTGGSWATTGCSVATLYEDSTACFCNHSTNFAVLLQVYDAQRSAEEESLLRTLSFVGCGVSFCALATTFLLFLAARVPKSERTMVHKNLTFSLASAEGFLMASEWAKANKVACMAVTAVMHLLFLVAFSWMLVEGLLLWSKVVVVSMRPGPRMTLYYATGWGVPVAIVAVTLALFPHDYVAAGHCWLNVHTDAIWAFVGPVLFVLTANTCILVCVVMVTVSSARRRARMLSPQPCLREQVRIQTWATVKPVLVLLPVLGLTWLVGVLVHLSPAWAYAAVGLNSFQGPYIFLVYAAYNREVRSALQRMTEKKATESFTACSSPIAQGSHPRSLGPWDVAQDNPVALAPARRHLAVRGTHGPRIPTTFSSIAEPERPAVELTAFKAAGGPSTRCGGVKAASPASLTRQPPPYLKAQGSLWASGVVWEKLRLREEMGETAQGPPGQNPPPQGFPQPQFPVPFRGPPPRFSASSAQHLPLRFLERVRADFTPGSAGDPCPTTPAGWTDGGHRTTTHCLCLSLSLRGFQQEPSLVPCEHGCAPQLSPPNFVQDCPPHTLPAALKC